MRKLLVLPFLLLLAASCVKAPPVTTPDIDVEVPDGWSADDVSNREVDGEWWTTFNDPNLNELIELALERNWNLQAAVARVERAEAQARIAGADLKPTVDAGLNGARQKVNFFFFKGPGSPSSKAMGQQRTGAARVITGPGSPRT